MKEIRGDLIKLAEELKFDVIIHGCNCFQIMGAGIALQIKNKYPGAFYADVKNTTHGDKEKLGSYTSFETPKGFTIVNAYTQYHYRGPNNVDYDAIEKVFTKIKKDFHGERIGYPKIGAGLAGGSWWRISRIIDRQLDGEDHTLVIWEAQI